MHLGASRENLDLVRRATDALPGFLEEKYLKVTKAVDMGDHTEDWLTAKEFGKPYENSEVIQATRSLYGAVFDDRQPVVLASAGNHQTEILDQHCTPDEAMRSSERASGDLSGFLAKVFASSPNADVSVFRGLKQTEDHIFAHHGDFLNVPERLREVLAELDDDMTPQQKMDWINSRPELYEDMQKNVWQKFKKYLWPALKNIPQFVNMTFPSYVLNAKLKAVVREGTAFDTSRFLAERWKNPLFDETLLQYELLNKLTDKPESSAIVSGHLHVPGITGGAQGLPGTVVSLGAWHDTHLNPVTGISMRSNDHDIFLLNEFDPATNKWNIRDERQI